MFLKRTYWGLSIFAVMLILAACATSPVPPPAPTIASGQPTASATSEAITTANQVPSVEDGYAGPPLTTEPITLRILRWQRAPVEEELFAQWIAEFRQAHPNITFEEEVVPFGQLAEKIQASVAGGNPPDLFFIDGPNAKSYAYFNILGSLEPYVTQAFKDDLVPATLAEHSYKGELYAMPERQSALALAYNSDMTEAAGIQPPQDIDSAWTWDQALEAWQKLQQDPSGSGNPTVWGLEPSRFGSGGAGFYYRDGIFPRSAGDPNAPPDSSLFKTFAALSPDGQTVKGYIDSPEAIEATQWFQDLTMKWNVTSKVGIPNAFLDGKAATTIDHDGLIARVKNTHPDGSFHFSYTPIPYFRTRLTMTGSNSSGISAKTAHPAEAAAFLIYIYSPKNALRYWQVNRGLPARISLYDQIPEYSEYPYSLFRQELLEIGVPRPSTPAWSAFDAIINAAIKDISLGAPVADRLHKAAEDIDQQLARFKE